MTADEENLKNDARPKTLHLSLVARHNPLERYFDSSEVDVLEDNKVGDDERSTEKDGDDDDVSFEEDFFASSADSSSSSSEEPRKEEDIDHEIRDIIQDRVREMQVRTWAG